MSNTYSDATGVLKFRGPVNATPVIKALFTVFELDTTYPGGSEAYIARISEQSSTSWDSIVDEITAQFEDLGLQLPELSDEDISIEELLGLMAEKFGCAHQVQEIIDAIDFDQDADLQDLFDLAMLFDDGHGLLSASFECGWHCDKPRLFEFGGAGEHRSAHVVAQTVSSTSINVGQQVDAAILDGKLQDAAEALATQALRAVEWAVNEPLAAATRATLARKLAAPDRKPIDLGGRTFQLFVGIGSAGEHTEAPLWMQIPLDQALVDLIAQHDQLISQHGLAYIESWCMPWWQGDHGMTCDVLVVGCRGFWFSAYPKHGLQAVETVHLDLGRLQTAVNEAVSAGRGTVRFGIDSDEIWLDCLEALKDAGSAS